MKKINGLYLLGILPGQNFVILISGLSLIRHPGWKKIPKKNKRPGTIIRDRRVHDMLFLIGNEDYNDVVYDLQHVGQFNQKDKNKMDK